MSRTPSSSGTQKALFYRKPSFNAQHTRMGEVGTRTQSVIDPPHSIHLNALGTSMVILNSYVATDLNPCRKIRYLLQQVGLSTFQVP
jgi:hypothetical protein